MILINNFDINLQVSDLESTQMCLQKEISSMRGEVATTRTAIHKIYERNTELGRQIVRHDEKQYTKDLQHLREIENLKFDHRKKMDDLRKTLEKDCEGVNRRRKDVERNYNGVVQGLKEQVESYRRENDDLRYKVAHQEDYIQF